MPELLGIKFKMCGRVYDFDSAGIEVKAGGSVVVESELGLSIGEVVYRRQAEDNPKRKLKPILRVATEEDAKNEAENTSLKDEAYDFCLERINARGLPMKLVCADTTLDKKRIIFYFVADGRIDFRELVKDLAAKFKTRIELRQIGVRDEAKMIGGLGVCGQELCCRRFLKNFEPISIKMAKQQDLVLNTAKLSGVCGRLMCCLGYEYGQEREAFVPRKAAKKEEEAPAFIKEETPAPEFKPQKAEAAPKPVAAERPERAAGEAPRPSGPHPQSKKHRGRRQKARIRSAEIGASHQPERPLEASSAPRPEDRKPEPRPDGQRPEGERKSHHHRRRNRRHNAGRPQGPRPPEGPKPPSGAPA